MPTNVPLRKVDSMRSLLYARPNPSFRCTSVKRAMNPLKLTNEGKKSFGGGFESVFMTVFAKFMTAVMGCMAPPNIDPI